MTATDRSRIQEIECFLDTVVTVFRVAMVAKAYQKRPSYENKDFM